MYHLILLQWWSWAGRLWRFPPPFWDCRIIKITNRAFILSGDRQVWSAFSSVLKRSFFMGNLIFQLNSWSKLKRNGIGNDYQENSCCWSFTLQNLNNALKHSFFYFILFLRYLYLQIMKQLQWNSSEGNSSSDILEPTLNTFREHLYMPIHGALAQFKAH